MRYFNQAYAIILLISIIFFLSLEFLAIGDVCLKGDEWKVKELCGVEVDEFISDQDSCPEGIMAFERTQLCAQSMVSYMTETTILIFSFNAVYAPAYFLYLRKR